MSRPGTGGSLNVLLVNHTITASFLRLLLKWRYKIQMHAEKIQFKEDFQYYAIENISRLTAGQDFATECAEKHWGGGMGEERKKRKTTKQTGEMPSAPWILISHSQHTHFTRKGAEKVKPCCKGPRKEQTHLWNEELASCELPLAGVHLPVGVYLGALQLFAAVHQRLHLRFHLADVKPCHGELLLNHPVHIC